MSLHAPLPSCSYNGGRSMDDFLKFINEKVRLQAQASRGVERASGATGQLN